jgi:HEAT repeat protein
LKRKRTTNASGKAHPVMASSMSSIDGVVERAKKAISLAGGGNNSVSQLMELAEDSNGEVRMRAVESLAQFSATSQILMLLKRCLTDSDELVRVEAGSTLGALGSKRALPWLRAALTDKSPLVRSYVAAAIGVLGDDTYRKHLVRVLSREESSTAKVGYFVALYQLGMRGAIISLLSLSRERDYRDRIAVAKNVGAIVKGINDCKLVLSFIPLILAEEKDENVARLWIWCRRVLQRQL